MMQTEQQPGMTLEEWMKGDLQETKKEIYGYLNKVEKISLEGILMEIRFIIELMKKRRMIAHNPPSKAIEMLRREIRETELEDPLFSEIYKYHVQNNLEKIMKILEEEEKTSDISFLFEEIEYNLFGYPLGTPLPCYRRFGKVSENFSEKDLDRFRRLKILTLELFDKSDYEELMKEKNPNALASIGRIDIITCLHDLAKHCAVIVAVLLDTIEKHEGGDIGKDVDLEDPSKWFGASSSKTP